MRRIVALAVVATVLTGCGHSRSSSSESTASGTTTATAPSTVVTTAATTTTATPSGATVRVYFLRDGKVAPVARDVPGPQVATLALNQLAAGPTASETGLTNQVKGGVLLKKISGGTATVDLVAHLSHAALAQVVYTLTQFPTVQRVVPLRSIGETAPWTRATFEDVTPSILVESPLPGAHVTSPLRVRGTANTFEATFLLDIRNESNRSLSRETVTATSGSGTRGTFDTTISFSATGPVTLVAYEASAENGRPIHVVRIPLDAG